MKTILLMDIVIVFVGIYLAVSAAKMKKSGHRCGLRDVSFRAVPAAGACGADFFIRQAKTSFAGYVFGAGYVFLI